MSTWEEKELKLRQYGASEDFINNEKQIRYQKAVENNVAQDTINNYFGLSNEMDMSKVKTMFADNLKKNGYSEDNNILENIYNAYGEGFKKKSISSMLYRRLHGENAISPEMMNPSHGDFFYKAAESAGALTADAPLYLIGSAIGKSAGVTIGGSAAIGLGQPELALPASALGGEIGATVGAFSFPAAIRSVLVNEAQNGKVVDFKDFTSRLYNVFKDTSKEAAIGLATYGAGQVAKAGAGMMAEGIGYNAEKALSMQSKAQFASEVATFTTLGALAEGHVPSLEDYAINVVAITGLHVATGVSIGSYNIATDFKLKEIWKRTGIKPEEITKMAAENPELREQLVTNSYEFPKEMENFVDPEYTSMVEKENAALEQKDVKVNLQEQPITQVATTPEIPAKELTPLEKTKEDLSSQIVVDLDVKDEKSPYMSTLSRFQNQNLAVKDLMQAFNKDLITEDSPFYLMQLYDKQVGLSNKFYYQGIKDKLGNVLAESPKKIIDELSNKNQFKDFSTYRIAKRYLEYVKKGLKIPKEYTEENLNEVVKEGDLKGFSEKEKQLQEWKKQALLYVAKNYEYMSEKTVEDITSTNLNHVNMKNVISESGDIITGSTPTIQKKAKGQKSANFIKDPQLSDFESIQAIMNAGYKNKIYKGLAKIFIENSNITGAKEVSRLRRVPTKLTENQVEKLNKEFDLEMTMDDAKAFTDFVGKSKPLAKNEIEYKENIENVETGEYENVTVRIGNVDTYILDIAKKLGSLEELNLFMRIMNKYKNIEQFGATEADPAWGINNFASDVWGSLIENGIVNPKKSINHVKNIFKTIPSILKRDEKYWDAISSGSMSGNFFKTQELINEAIKLDLETEKNGFSNKARNLIKDTKTFFAAANEVTSLSTKMAQREMMLKEGYTEAEANYSASEVRTNFRTRGTSELNNMLSIMRSFRSAGFNATAKTWDLLSKKEVVYSSLALITTVKLSQWYKNKDREEVKALGEWEKIKYIHFVFDNWQKANKDDMPLYNKYMSYNSHLAKLDENGVAWINKSSVHRIKMPEVFGAIFGYLPEKMVQHIYESDKEGFAKIEDGLFGLAKGAGEMSFLNYDEIIGIPSGFVPIIEQLSAKDYFTKLDTVGAREEKGMPEVQYSKRTSATSQVLSRLFAPVPSSDMLFSAEDEKKLSYIQRKSLPYVREASNEVLKKMNEPIFGIGLPFTSPVVFDNWVNKWTGGYGKHIFSVVDGILRKTGVAKGINEIAKDEADIPIWRGITSRKWSSSGFYVVEFNKKAKEAEAWNVTLNSLKSKMDYDRYQELVEPVMKKNASVMAFTNAIKSARITQAAVDKMKDISPDERKSYMDSIGYEIMQMSKSGLLLIDEMDKEMKQLEEENK